MKMPAHIDQLKFYQEAVKKNIQIESRYEGVSLFLSWHQAPRWRAQCTKGEHPVVIGTFPLTEVGEKAAANAYIAYSKGNAKPEDAGMKPQNVVAPIVKRVATRKVKAIVGF